MTQSSPWTVGRMETRNSLLGDVQLRHHLDAADNGLVVPLVDGVHRLIERAVDAVLDRHLGLAGLDMDVRGAPLDGVEEGGVDQLDDRALILGNAVDRQHLRLVALALDQLDTEVFGRFVEHPLGAFGLLQDLLDGGRGADLDLDRLAEEQLELVEAAHVRGIRHDHRHPTLELLLGDERIAEHQVEGNAPEQVVLDAEVPDVDELQAEVGGQSAGLCLFRRRIDRQAFLGFISLAAGVFEDRFHGDSGSPGTGATNRPPGRGRRTSAGRSRPGAVR